MRKIVATGAAFLALTSPILAQEAKPIEPETLGVEKAIKPGPNVFTLDQSWDGSSKINVLGADDLSIKGNIGVGLIGQMVLSADGSKLYTSSVYAKRITYGPQEAIVHEWDVATLSPLREFNVSEKMAMVEPQPVMLALADAEKYLLVQDATPATSINVIDLAKGAPIAEIPTPGCWGAIPTTGTSFLTVCGDGSMKTFSFAADGSFGAPKSGAGIFDADADALFTNPARVGDDFYFASFKGNLYHVTVKDGVPALADKFSLVTGSEGWAPGGSEVITYHAGTGIAFVLMHSGAAEGSHKNAAEEIWAVDLKTKEVLYRSVAHHENSLTVSKSSPPVLFGTTEEGELNRYEVHPEARSAAKFAGSIEEMGTFLGLVLTSQ